ncbi:MAG: hypothetical protein Q9166_006180 [cf. Caloplaca sp. 2 TL-2023]
MTSGIATPLGPCKRCEKARVECTSTNAATSTSAKRKDVNTTEAQPNPTKSSARQDSPNVTNSSLDTTDELGSFSPLGMPLFNNIESTLTDQSLFLDTFDFDLGTVGGESIDPFDLSSSVNRGLPSPNKSQEGSSSKESKTAEHTQFGESEDVVGNGLAMSDLLNTPSTESPGWSGDHPPSTAAGTVDQLGMTNPLTETLNKLSDLQSFIFREFGSISEDTLATAFLSQATLPCHGPGSAPQDGNLVGKVLYASECLIDILTSCGRNEADLPSVTSRVRSRSSTLTGSKRTHSTLLDDDEILHADMSSSASFRLSSPTANTRTTHLDLLRKTNGPNEWPPSLPKRTSSAESETPIYSGLLSPAKLTLLVCYVTLLSVYRSILSQAFDMLRTPLPPSPRSRAPRLRSFHGLKATPPTNPAMSTATILGFRIQLEMLTHT